MSEGYSEKEIEKMYLDGVPALSLIEKMCHGCQSGVDCSSAHIAKCKNMNEKKSRAVQWYVDKHGLPEDHEEYKKEYLGQGGKKTKRRRRRSRRTRTKRSRKTRTKRSRKTRTKRSRKTRTKRSRKTRTKRSRKTKRR